MDTGARDIRELATTTASDSLSLALANLEPTFAGDPFAVLAGAAALGDRGATERLLSGLAPRILAAVRAVLGPRHLDVDDVVQESLVALVRALPAFEGRSSVAHYASRIAVRVALAARKRARAEQRLDTDAHAALSADTTSRRPYRQLLRDRRRALVRLLLDDLPEAQSEAIALRICLGLPMEEVAQMTGAPLNTVYSRLRLAKEALRARILRDPVLREMLEEP